MNMVLVKFETESHDSNEPAYNFRGNKIQILSMKEEIQQ